MRPNRPAIILRILLPALVVMLASLACYAPEKNSAVENTPAVEAPTEAAATQPAALFPTETPADSAAAPTPTQTEAAPQAEMIEYYGVAFQKIPAAFSGATGSIASMETGEAGLTGWIGASPEHYQFFLDGYALAEPWIKPQVLVYPIQQYAAVNAAAGDVAAQLDMLLRVIEVQQDSRPFLPFWGAAQVFNARAEILPFKDGKGVRFLSCYAQAMVPIDDHCLFYTYQGLSADGKYYVSAVLPVDLPMLESADYQAKWAAIENNFEADAYLNYLAEIRQALASAGPEAFTPNLNDLDALAKSLVVRPTLQLKAPETAAFSCSGALATRLVPASRARVTFTDGTPLRVRETPGKSGKVLKTLPEGTEMFIIEGPQCANQGAWWRMQNNNGSIAGWVMEGENGVYFIEPWN